MGTNISQVAKRGSLYMSEKGTRDATIPRHGEIDLL